MEKLIQNILSFEWWVGVVAAGILINLAAAYLKPFLDIILGSVSRSIAQRNDQKKREKEERIENLKEKKHDQTLSAIGIVYLYIRATIFYLLSIVLFLLGSIVMNTNLPKELFIFIMLIGAITLMLGLNISLSAQKDNRELYIARFGEKRKSTKGN